MTQVVVPWSGGVDSTYLIYHLLNESYEIFPYHVDYGDFRNEVELRMMLYELTHLKAMSLPGMIHTPVCMSYSSPDHTYAYQDSLPADPRSKYDVPFRNAILFSMGVAYAETLQIPLVATSVEDDAPYRDHSYSFIQAFNILCQVSSPVRLSAPIRSVDVGARYRALYEIGLHHLVNVARCKDPRKSVGAWVPCGSCIMCQQAKEMLIRDYGTDEYWMVADHPHLASKLDV